MDKKPKIFIVDNELQICTLLKDFFDFIGYESFYETDGEKVLRELEGLEYDVMFLDLKLDTISGIDILLKSKAVKPLAEVIVVTGYGSEETVLKTFQYGASSYIQKPISFSDIRRQTEEALARRRYNTRTDTIARLLPPGDHNLVDHITTMVNIDRLFLFLNLTIDIDTLADSILTGLSKIVAADQYVFFFFDKVNREMVIHSLKPIPEGVFKAIEREVVNRFQSLANIDVKSAYNLRPSHGTVVDPLQDDIPDDGLVTAFSSLNIDNTTKGIVGAVSLGRPFTALEMDILVMVSGRISHVLSNATLHRDTKLLALTDGLTGLLNHRAFHDRLRQEFDRFKRYGAPVSLIIADIDNLKSLNDTHGHPLGDEVIRKVGRILLDTSRESDVLARYGGDEFVALLPQTNPRNALMVAERIRSRVLETVISIQGIDIHCSMSMGVATVPMEGVETPLELFDTADKALYEAKRGGKNRVITAEARVE